MAAFRRRVPELPPLRVRIDKRIPVAAGLGGGSADAAAVLRAANRIAGDPLDAAALRELGAELGSDVPSQVDPRHALVSGVGEVVEPVELPAVRRAARAPETRACRPPPCTRSSIASAAAARELDLDALRSLTREMTLLPVLGNDLQPAALALRPELGACSASLRGRGRARRARQRLRARPASALFEGRAAAEAAAARFEGALVTSLRRC